MDINIYMLFFFLLMLVVIFCMLGYRVISPALGKKRYWEVAIKITLSFVLFGALYFLFTFIKDCSNTAILIAALIMTLFLLIILIRKDVQTKMKELKGGRK